MTSTANVLAVETSGRTASIAIGIGHDTKVRSLSETGRRHARTLVPELDDLLASSGLTPNDFDAVGVAIGPGSFTGLRVGVAFAKTLAWACDLQIVGVNTFDVLARQASAVAGEVWLAMNAERSQLFVAETRVEDGQRYALSHQIVDEQEWIGALSETATVSGPLPAKSRVAIEQRCRVLDAEIGTPNAETIVGLTRERLAAGVRDDPTTLLPTYGRLSAAEELAAAKK